MTPISHKTETEVAAFPIVASRGFVDWLVSQDVSLAISTYQTGKLFLVGHNRNGQFSVFERTFERAMGLAGNDQTIYMATLFQLWRLENVLTSGETTEGYDRSYVPQVGSTTGDLDRKRCQVPIWETRQFPSSGPHPVFGFRRKQV